MIQRLAWIFVIGLRVDTKQYTINTLMRKSTFTYNLFVPEVRRTTMGHSARTLEWEQPHANETKHNL